MSDEFIWLRHRDSGGHFRCPAAAVEDMAELGWEPSEAPEEINPAVAEQLAWRREQLARQRAEEPESTKPATRGKSKEMSDG